MTTRTLLMVAGLPTLALGVFLVWKGYRLWRTTSEYEFNNSTDAGVVQFESFRVAWFHGIRQRLAIPVFFLGLLGALGGTGMTLRSLAPEPLGQDEFCAKNPSTSECAAKLRMQKRDANLKEIMDRGNYCLKHLDDPGCITYKRQVERTDFCFKNRHDPSCADLKAHYDLYFPEKKSK